MDAIRDTTPVSTFGARGKAREVGLRRDEASPKRSRRVVASVRSHSCRAVAVTVETNHDRDVPADRVAESVAAYTAHAREYETAHAMKRLDAVERFARSLPAPSLILDVGCGPGRDLARFTSLGHVARGVELNPVFAAMANAHAPTVLHDIRELRDLLPAGFVDGIWAAASLVHLSTYETVEVLGQFAQLLRPGGRLHASVSGTGETGWMDEPDGRRWYTVWPSERFAEAVAAAGFQLDAVRTDIFVEVWGTRER